MSGDGMIRAVIVDDNPSAIAMLSDALAAGYADTVRVVATAASLRGAGRAIEAYHPDLLFLDVELPDGSGVEYAGELRRQTAGSRMKVVLYTSFEKYLIDALRANAFDFLLKPLVTSEFHTVMKRFIADRATVGPATPLPVRSNRMLITTATGEKIVVNPDSVGYFSYLSDRKRWEVRLDSGQAHLLSGQISADDIMALAPQYVRIHKTFIININHLALIQDNTCVMMPPFDSATDLKVSKNFRKDLVDRFYSL